MKLFNSANIDVINDCRWYFDFELPSEMLAEKGTKFERKFVDHKNLHCHFVGYLCDLFGVKVYFVRTCVCNELVCLFPMCVFITGPPNGPVLFCSLASVGVCRLSSSSATGRAGRPAAGRSAGRAVDTARRVSRVTSR